jgi:hypothetical protein
MGIRDRSLPAPKHAKYQLAEGASNRSSILKGVKCIPDTAEDAVLLLGALYNTFVHNISVE